MRNKAIKILILCVICAFCIVGYTSYGYSDVSNNHWAYEVINKLSSEQILTGYPNGTFCPDNNMTRAEFITVLIKTIEPKLDVSCVLGYWADKSINVAIDKNILKIEEYDAWNPEENITRSEMFKMLVRALGIFAYDDISSAFDIFTDINLYSDEEKKILTILYKLDIISGYPDGSCRLESLSTRAEVCSIISKFMDKTTDFFRDNLVIYEDDVAIINKNKLPYELKVWRGSDDLSYVTTEIKDINCFEFNNIPDKYKEIFNDLYNSDDLYSKYRVKFLENNFVIAIDVKTINNTKNSEVFTGHEFLHISFFEEDIKILDSFDIDEIMRQKNKNASVGEKVLPGESKDTSAFYVVNKLSNNKVRIDRNITELYDINLEEIKKVSSFNSLIIRIKEEERI